MGHDLGIDLGTTFVAAAVARDRRAENGSLTSGDAAARRAVSDPDRGTHDLERRLGVSAPVTALLGTLLRTVLAGAVEISVGEPDTVVFTHPATGVPAQCQARADVAESAGLTRCSTVTEPEAAAAHHGATRHFETGEVFAVSDLGGGTLDATVLRRTADGTEVTGAPGGVECLGGADSTDAVLAHVDAAAGGFLHRLDLSDARTVVALARLRQDCTAAEEALSFDMGTTIPVLLPSRHMEVRLSGQEFEDMIRVPVESTLSPPGEPASVGSV